MIKKPKIKVLHIVEALGGGVYSYFCDLSHVLGEKANVDLYIAYSNKRDEIDPLKVRHDLHENTHLILVPFEKEISPKKDLAGIQKIKTIVSQLEPDIVHLHSSKAGILGKIALHQLRYNKPSYYTPHGYAFLRQDVNFIKRTFYKIIESVFAKFSKTVTVACGDTELVYALKINPNARLIRNGINLNKLNSSIEAKEVNTIVYGTLGRISFQKNPKLFNSIALKHKDQQFLWIGDGEMRPCITAHNINITGWFKNRNKALPFLKKLDVYIQTSLWEGLPIAVIEAMAMELPVIATNVIGNKDLVKHGITGFLFDNENDFDHYAVQLQDKKLRYQMGKAARLRVEQYFDCQKNFNALLDLYYGDLASNNEQKY